MSLQRLHLVDALLVAATTAACSGADGSKILAQAPARGADSSGFHEMQHEPEIKWGPAPPIFPAGALFAVVQGDPSVPGALFTVRLRFPNNYILPPHTHPTDEHVTVLRGTLGLTLPNPTPSWSSPKTAFVPPLNTPVLTDWIVW